MGMRLLLERLSSASLLLEVCGLRVAIRDRMVTSRLLGRSRFRRDYGALLTM